jgi:putative spermidine/putrescine transport system substrate-binding protein
MSPLPVVALAVVCVVGCSSGSTAPELSDQATWDEVVRLAEGQTIRIGMWDGDPMINAYLRDWVAPQLLKKHGITLQQVGSQGASIVSRLIVDLENGRRTGDFDLVWINGETFYQLRKMHALYGPFTHRLPHNKYIDWKNRFIAVDFQQPVDGYECPWGNVQLTLIYNSQSIAEPPRSLEALAKWIQRHPGRFTFDNSFTGMTFLKSLLYEFAGGKDSLDGPFDEAKYLDASAKLWVWLRDLQPHFWRNGETFPDSVAQLHQLFSNNEVDFTMSNNDGEVDNKVHQGILPEFARAYVLDSGTIRNSHYLGIPVNAPNKAAAMVVANFLISPEAQLQKAMPDVWGDGTVLSTELLPDEWKAKLENIQGRIRVPPRSELESSALLEPAPEIMIRLNDDFRREIIERVQ